MNLQRTLSLAFAALVLTGAIGALSVPPAMSEAIAAGLDDHAKRLGGYAGLTFLGAFLFGPRGQIKVALGLLPLTAGFEVLQAILPTGREASVGDAAANFTGWAVGTGLLLALAGARRNLGAVRAGVAA